MRPRRLSGEVLNLRYSKAAVREGRRSGHAPSLRDTLSFVLHSMEPRERELALEVLSVAWLRLAAGGTQSILAVVREEAAALPERHSDVSADFADHIGAAAVWYLDRATRRVGDPDRDGLTAAQRAVNLARFNAEAGTEDIERLFAVASALNDEDV